MFKKLKEDIRAQMMKTQQAPAQASDQAASLGTEEDIEISLKTTELPHLSKEQLIDHCTQLNKAFLLAKKEIARLKTVLHDCENERENTKLLLQKNQDNAFKKISELKEELSADRETKKQLEELHQQELLAKEVKIQSLERQLSKPEQKLVHDCCVGVDIITEDKETSVETEAMTVDFEMLQNDVMNHIVETETLLNLHLDHISSKIALQCDRLKNVGRNVCIVSEFISGVHKNDVQSDNYKISKETGTEDLSLTKGTTYLPLIKHCMKKLDDIQFSLSKYARDETLCSHDASFSSYRAENAFEIETQPVLDNVINWVCQKEECRESFYPLTDGQSILRTFNLPAYLSQFEFELWFEKLFEMINLYQTKVHTLLSKVLQKNENLEIKTLLLHLTDLVDVYIRQIQNSDKNNNYIRNEMTSLGKYTASQITDLLSTIDSLRKEIEIKETECCTLKNELNMIKTSYNAPLITNDETENKRKSEMITGHECIVIDDVESKGAASVQTEGSTVTISQREIMERNEERSFRSPETRRSERQSSEISQEMKNCIHLMNKIYSLISNKSDEVCQWDAMHIKDGETADEQIVLAEVNKMLGDAYNLLESKLFSIEQLNRLFEKCSSVNSDSLYVHTECSGADCADIKLSWVSKFIHAFLEKTSQQEERLRYSLNNERGAMQQLECDLKEMIKRLTDVQSQFGDTKTHADQLLEEKELNEVKKTKAIEKQQCEKSINAIRTELSSQINAQINELAQLRLEIEDFKLKNSQKNLENMNLRNKLEFAVENVQRAVKRSDELKLKLKSYAEDLENKEDMITRLNEALIKASDRVSELENSEVRLAESAEKLRMALKTNRSNEINFVESQQRLQEMYEARISTIKSELYLDRNYSDAAIQSDPAVTVKDDVDITPRNSDRSLESDLKNNDVADDSLFKTDSKHRIVSQYSFRDRENTEQMETISYTRQLPQDMITLEEISPLVQKAQEHNVEIDYLKRVVFAYMTGVEPRTMAKVICAVLKYNKNEQDIILNGGHTKQARWFPA